MKPPSRKHLVRFLFAIAFLVTCLGIGKYASSPRTLAALHSPAAAKAPIQHIVIMDKENRSFDSMFGRFPGANGTTTYPDPHGNIHPLNHQPDHLTIDINHDPSSAHLAYNSGKMDKFSLIPGAIQKGVDVADSQFYQVDIPKYWQYAQTFTLADTFFSTIMGPSFPNHLWSIAGENDNVDGNLQPNPHYPYRWGCDAPGKVTVEQRLPNGTINRVRPCFQFQTMGDLLDAHGISWKYYAPSQDQPGYQWSSFNAIDHIRNGVDWAQHVVDYTKFAKDAMAGTLPAVSWLVEPITVSDHPPSSICTGENWTVQQINAVMQNPTLWGNTAIILTWDDFGGFYDHVAPPKGPNSQIEYGFRVPTIVMSAYTKAGFIDHTMYNASSMLKFVETTFGLPAIGNGTGLDATAHDIGQTQNYAQKPLPPLMLSTRICPP